MQHGPRGGGEFASISFISNVILSRLCWFRLKTVFRKGDVEEKKLLLIHIIAPDQLITWPAQGRGSAGQEGTARDAGTCISHQEC